MTYLPQSSRPENYLKPDSPESDANLVAAVGAGDMHALGELVDRHQRGILLFAYRTLGKWDLAEDVAQEVFLRAYLFLDNISAADRFTGYCSEA